MSELSASPDHILRRAPSANQMPARTRPITAEKVVEVALNPDDELRNLQVALLYSITSRRMDDQLFPRKLYGKGAPPNANWFTMAQWAVLTVGRNLRTRDVPHRASRLPEPLRRRLTPAILSLRASEDRTIAAALSFGQVMVLVSVYQALLATPFADGAVIASAPANDDAEAKAEEKLRRETVLQLAARLGANVSRINGTGPRTEFYEAVLEALAAHAEHQKDLTDAFELYKRAMPDRQVGAAARGNPDRPPADLVFEANLRLAAIEQVILDEAITMVIDHVPQYAADEVEGRVATFAERSLRVPRRIAQITTSRRLAGMTTLAREVWARVMTDQVMVLALPSETLRLGRDLPPRDWQRPFYCETLLKLSREAQEVFDAFDRSLGDGRGAGAGDWRRFDDRLNFVANLLRSRHSEPSLFWQPFTDEDVAKIWEGRYPSRIGDPYEQAVRGPYFPGRLGDDPKGIAHDCEAPIA